MENRREASGFTLVEILVALSILAIVMTILSGAFSTSAVTVRVVDERAEALSSLSGALDTLSQEVRGAYDSFSGKPSTMTFTAMTPFQGDDAPVVQTLSYEFEERRLLRRTYRTEPDAQAARAFLLLEDVDEPSFSFFDGKRWTDEWRVPGKLPAGVKVTFSYKRRTVEMVIPVWSRK